MARRKIARRPLRKPAIGDMRDRLTIVTRVITAPVFGSGSFTEAYTDVAPVWGSVTTLPPGREIFDGVAMADQPTHVFRIRFRADTTSQNLISWASEYYKILKISDQEERHQFLVLFCRLVGDDSLEANQ